MAGCIRLTAALINVVVALHGSSSRIVSLSRDSLGVSTHEQSKAEVMSNMTLEKAYNTFLRMNQSKFDHSLTSFIQSKVGAALKGVSKEQKRSEPTGYSAVDSARDMLNEMIDEALMKRELEEVRCNEFETKQVKILKELEMDIAYVNS